MSVNILPLEPWACDAELTTLTKQQQEIRGVTKNFGPRVPIARVGVWWILYTCVTKQPIYAENTVKHQLTKPNLDAVAQTVLALDLQVGSCKSTQVDLGFQVGM